MAADQAPGVDRDFQLLAEDFRRGVRHGRGVGAGHVVYVTVFGAGVFYLLRLMRTTPTAAAQGPEKGMPSHAAGITPAPALVGDSSYGGHQEPEPS